MNLTEPCEDYSVGMAGLQGDASIRVGSYRKAVGLRRILVTYEQANYICAVHRSERPRVWGCAVADAIIETRQISDY
jgi:hypothetical protein